ncbi:MAG TPA: TIGR02147 family protein [Chitinispirillaceae bacterium]|nr:TIGR02147 family protein [Chitinispirillaceae bacterium]
MVSFFDYTDYRQFLKDFIKERQKSKQSFSLRCLSMKAGIKSGGFLSMVLCGRRNLTKELAGRISSVLKMSKKEEKYFLLMVDYAHAKTIEQKHSILEQMLVMTRMNSVKSLVPEQYEFYEKWYYSVMRELVEVTPLKENSASAGEMFQPPIRQKEARQALKLLEKLGLIYKDSEGVFHRTDTLITCDDSIRSVAVCNFQAEMIELAKTALKQTGRSERDISTVTLSIDSSTWEQIRQRCASFRADLLALATRVMDPDRVIQINLQCFPVTKLNDWKVKSEVLKADTGSSVNAREQKVL